jgi:hypothetical protein
LKKQSLNALIVLLGSATTNQKRILQYFGHFLSERVNKKGHSWLNVSAQRYLQPGNGL